MTFQRLVFVVSGKSPTTMPGGLGAYAYNVARVLNSIGYRVVIVGFSSKDEVVDLGFAKLVHFSSPFSKLLGLGSLFLARRFARVMEELSEGNGDILVYSAGLWGFGSEVFKRRMKAKGVRVQTWAGYFSTYKHDYWGQVLGTRAADYGFKERLLVHGIYCMVRLVHSPIEHKLLRSVDRIIVHYDSTRRILLAELPELDPRRLAKIPYCIELFDRRGEPANVQPHSTSGLPVVTVLCRQDPRKGISVFLRAVLLLKQRRAQARFQIAGNGVFLESNKKLSRKLGLENDVKFLGFVNSAEAVLAESDIYVLPSLEEGSGAISLLEAMKSGVAIVTTWCDGIPEDFSDGETALLTEPGNAKSLADAIERLLNDRPLRMRLAEQAKKSAETRFGIKPMEDGIRALLS